MKMKLRGKKKNEKKKSNSVSVSDMAGNAGHNLDFLSFLVLFLTSKSSHERSHTFDQPISSVHTMTFTVIQ